MSGMTQAVSQSICAVVVTYNRKEILPLALDALRRQTRPIAEIIVVDNQSMDGTGDMLRERYPDVTCVRLHDNLGYGAGLAFGIEDGMRRGHGYFWMLDDDSVPDDMALERCMAVAASHEGFGIVGLNGGLWRRGPRHFRSLKGVLPAVLGNGERECDFVLVDGALVSREATIRAGLPRKDFFMMMEDLDFSRRIKLSGLRVFAIEGQLIERGHLGSTGSANAAWRGYYQTRNHLAMVIAERSAVEFVWWAVRQARFMTAALFHGKGSSTRIRLRLLGAWHGLIGRMGRTIEPASAK